MQQMLQVINVVLKAANDFQFAPFVRIAYLLVNKLIDWLIVETMTNKVAAQKEAENVIPQEDHGIMDVTGDRCGD